MDTLSQDFDPAPGHMAGGGAMGVLMRAQDWSKTLLGPSGTWSQSLCSATSICLNTRFPIAIYWGTELALLYNDAWSPIAGAKHPWALGRRAREVWPEIWDTIGPLFDRVAETGEGTYSEDQLLPMHRRGFTEECYFNFTFSPIRGDDGRIAGVFNAVVETTYRVIDERRTRVLRELAEHASAARTTGDACAFSGAALATATLDVPFCLLYLLDGASRTARLAATVGLNGEAPVEVGLDDAQPAWPFAAVVRSGRAELVEDAATAVGFAAPAGPWPEPVRQVLVAPIATATRPGEPPLGFLVAGLSPRLAPDTGYRAFVERAAVHIAGAVSNARAYEEERRRTEQLAELDRAKTAFFSNASHEFRTPLTLMLGPVQDMLEEARDGQVVVREAELERVHRNGLRLLKLVNTLLDFSRIEAGRVRAAFRSTDLARSTTELASTFRSAMKRAGLRYEVDCPPLPEPAWVDRDMWEKVVLNLLSNAFKYTLEGGVAVRLRAVADAAELSVADTGTGIPAAEVPRVFERFHRIEGQRGRTHEGSGIGLALVQELARLHGGEARAESVEGKGSIFTVRIPFGRARAAEAAVDEAAPVSTATSAAAYVEEALRWLPEVAGEVVPIEEVAAHPAALRTEGGRVLLADDNADMRDYVRRLLAEAGYRVEAAADGAEALRLATALPPDLVLSDVMMPRLDGFGLLRALREAPATADLPIILLSARAGEEAAVEGLDAGADDYLVKPFSARELIARVEGALRLSRQRRESTDALRALNDTLEQQVAERTQERDQIWMTSQDLLCVTNSDGVLRSANPAWTTVLGWRREEILGRTSEWLEHPDDRAKTRSEAVRLAEGDRTAGFGNRLRTRAGDYRHLSWIAVSMDGLFYCSARDVTEQTLAMEQLARTEDALRQSQKMEAVGQLTGGLAHDFNNLLTGIIGSLELLQTRVAQGRYKEVERYTGAAQSAARRAAALTHRLLAFSRRQTLDPKATDANSLVGGLEDLIRRTVGPAVTIEVVAAVGLWTTLVDPPQLESALLNLCINARDAMPDGGQITIETANRWLDEHAARERDLQLGQYVSICVTDTGTGMTPDVVARAFDPFFTTKPLGQGTGLGLSMIYGFARQSGGQVRIYSEVGQGTTMCLYLPRHYGEAEAAGVSPDLADAPRAKHGETVLVVDDEVTVRMLVTEVLADLGYAAVEAADGASGLKVLQSDIRIDLLVTDVGLPGGMNGRQMADAACRIRPGLKVLFITGYAENAAIGHGHLEPGMHVMTKPFSLEALARRIKALIEIVQADNQ